MNGIEKERVKVTQSCMTFCDPMDYTVHGILQARILEWVAVPFSRDRIQVFRIAGGFFTTKPPGKPILKSCISSRPQHSEESLT